MDTGENPLTRALAYAQEGWPVLPLYEAIADRSCACGDPACSRVGKHPRTKNGYKDASKDPDQINDWWTRWPDANIGICTGSESGIVVLDVDPRNEGDDALGALVEEHGELPVTPQVATGGGGRHYYFRYPEGLDEPLRKKVLELGLELLSEAGYVVAPPSLHASGRAYEWVDGRHPTDVPLAAMPEWLLRLATTSSIPETRSLDELLDEAGALPPNATVSDVETWLHEAARIAVSPDVSGRQVLFRQIAIDQLSKVETIKRGAAGIFDEAVAAAKGHDRSDAESGDPEGEEISPELRVKALSLLSKPQLLDLAAGVMDMLGLQGEKLNRVIVFLAAISGHLGRAIHLVIKGPSAGGKNTLVRIVLALFPPDRVRWWSSISRQALVYMPSPIEGILVIDEAEGQQDAQYLLRVAMSEGRVSRATVSQREDGGWEGQELEVEITASLITTTTELAIHAENATRVWDIQIDDTEALTAQVIHAEARRARGEVLLQLDAVLTLWRAAVRLLQPAEVVIPYTEFLADAFPSRPLRARRDFKRFLKLIKACALLHQYQRERDPAGRVVATLQDYALTLPLLQHVVGPSMLGLSEKALEIFRLQRELEAKTPGLAIKRIHLQNECGKRGIASPETVRKCTAVLHEQGIFDGEKEKGAWNYKIARDPESSAIPLPMPDELESLMGTGDPLL